MSLLRSFPSKKKNTNESAKRHNGVAADGCERGLEYNINSRLRLAILKNTDIYTMKKLLILLLSALSLTAVAQRPKMAVYTLGNDTRNELLQDYLISVFSESGKYSVVERTPQFLKALQQEYTFQQSGLVDEEELSKIGKQYGIRYICIAEEYEIKETSCLAIRLIDVETAAQVGNYYSLLADNMNLYRVISSVKDWIEAQMERPTISKKKVAVHVVNYEL